VDGSPPALADGELRGYLRRIGVVEPLPATSVFDPGGAPAMLESHLEQSAHLMLSLKISMACWMIASEAATNAKVAAARRYGVFTTAGGGPYEVAVAQGALADYLALCRRVGFDAIECGHGFTQDALAPEQVVRMAREHGLAVDFELGDKHGGPFTAEVVGELIEEGKRWLAAGARRLIVEGRESGQSVGCFDDSGRLMVEHAERLAEAFGLRTLIFEAPAKPSQFAFLNHFGPEVQLGNVRLDELLRVEIYRRGLHSDAFSQANLRPRRPAINGRG
jgi:phosphosulfolactate synthase